MATKRQFNKTEKAHQDEIFKVKGREPTNYGADVNDADKDESWITSKMTDGKVLHTHHDHKTGKITHKLNEEIEMADDTELDEAYVSKATLARYRAKAKADFRAKGGISAALDKDKDKDDKVKKPAMAKEEVEQLDELSPKTLKSYTKKATTSRQRAWDKGDKEEDKAMSTDGNKYPEKQARHQAAANVQHKKWLKREKGLDMASKKLKKEEVEPIDEIGFANKFAPLKKSAPNSGYMHVGGGKYGFNSSNPDMRINRRAGLDKDIGWDENAPKSQAKQAAQMDKFKKKAALRKEDDTPHIVDLVMVDENPQDASPYISNMETRMNELVAGIKDEMKMAIFDMNEARKPKPGAPGGSWVPRDVADRFKKQAAEKKQFAGAKREIDKLKKKGK